MQGLITSSSLIASAILFLLSLFVYVNAPNKKINLSFFLYYAILAVWSFGIFGLVSGYESNVLLWLKIMSFGVVFIPFSFLFFISNLLSCNYKPALTVIILSFALSVFYFFLNFTPYFFAGVTKVKFGYVGLPAQGHAFLFFVIYVVVTMAYGQLLIFLELIKSKGHRANQLLFILTASAIFTIGGLSVVPTLMGIVVLDGFPLWNFTNIAYGIIIAYAITRHHLLDIEIVIKKTAFYSILTALLTAIFVALIFVSQRLLSGLTGYTSFFAALIGSFIIALIFQPLRDKIQELVNEPTTAVSGGISPLP